MWRIYLALGAAVLALAGCGGKTVLASESPDRKDVQLTIYKEDFAMVSEVRTVALNQGRNSLSIKDVSAVLDPRSVLFGWQSPENAPTLVSNTYDMGIANGEALVKRYLGKPVELVRYSNTGRAADKQEGVLMAAEGGNYVLQTEDNFYINPPGTIVAGAESGVVTIPRLGVVAESAKQSEEDLRVAYLTRGLSWSADYVGIIGAKDLNLQCWATVDNQSGVDYPNAKITLVAGSPNRVARDKGRERGVQFKDFEESGNMAAMRPNAVPSSVVEPQAIGDLQSYAVKDKSSIAQQQLNRLMMLESKNVSAIKDYSVALPSLDYDYYWRTDRSEKATVTAALTFFNSKKNGLGDALPAGAIRLYEKSSDGELRYVGGAAIQDTPEGEKVNFTLSNAFDVIATNRIVSKQKVGKSRFKTAEVVLKNKKDSPIEIRVVQEISGNWKLVSSSHSATKLNARTLQWKPTVPADGEVKLRYTVSTK